MKKFAVLSAVAVLAAAGAAQAQGLSALTLSLRIVSQTGTPGQPGGVTSLAGSHADLAASNSSRVRRFEVQWQANGDLGADVFAGLSAGQFNITASTSGGNVPFTLERALISARELSGSQNAAAAPTTDTSAAAANGARGLQAPYRGGIPAPAPNNNDPANGIIAADQKSINLITPVLLAENDALGTGTWFGLYSFNVIVGDANLGTDSDGDGFANLNFTISAVADAQTGNKWGGFIFGNPVPQTSPNANSGSTSFRVEIPAPGSLALVGLGGLVAARRRRA